MYNNQILQLLHRESVSKRWPEWGRCLSIPAHLNTNKFDIKEPYDFSHNLIVLHILPHHPLLILKQKRSTFEVGCFKINFGNPCFTFDVVGHLLLPRFASSDWKGSQLVTFTNKCACWQTPNPKQLYMSWS